MILMILITHHRAVNFESYQALRYPTYRLNVIQDSSSKSASQAISPWSMCPPLGTRIGGKNKVISLKDAPSVNWECFTRIIDASSGGSSRENSSSVGSSRWLTNHPISALQQVRCARAHDHGAHRPRNPQPRSPGRAKSRTVLSLVAPEEWPVLASGQ